MYKLDDLSIDEISDEQSARLVVAREIELRKQEHITDEDVDAAIRHIYGYRRRNIEGWIWILRSIRAMDEAANEKFLELTIADFRVWEAVQRPDAHGAVKINFDIYANELVEFLELYVTELLFYRFSRGLYDPLIDLEAHEDFELLANGAHWHVLRDAVTRNLLRQLNSILATYAGNMWEKIEEIVKEKYNLYIHQEYGDTSSWAMNYISEKLDDYDRKND